MIYLPVGGKLFHPFALSDAATAAFSPTDIAGLKLWLKTDAGLYQERTGASATTPANADGDPVGSWLDQSGQSNHMTATADSRRPTLKTSVNAVRGDGVDDFLTATFTLTQPVTTYLVLSQVVWHVGDYIYDGIGGDKNLFIQSPSSPSIRMYGGAYLDANGVSLATGTFGILCGIFNGASSQQRLNAGTAITGNAGSNNPGGVNLFGRTGATPANVDIKEVLVYAGAHDTTTETQVRNYLNTRNVVY